MGISRSIIFLYCVFLGTIAAHAQQDSIQQPETTRRQAATLPVQPKKQADSTGFNGQDTNNTVTGLAVAQPMSIVTDSNTMVKKVMQESIKLTDTSTYRKYEVHPGLPLLAEPVYRLIEYHTTPSRDEFFYIIMGVLLLLASIRSGFPKYFRNLFLLFFQTSLRQKQTRDQLLQDNWASLFTNLLFIVSAGLYITLLIQIKHWSDLPFWWMAAGSAGLLGIIYLVKYLFLLFAGWVFNSKESAGSYIFLVFLVNKIIGILLVPFLVIMAFASFTFVQVAITASVIILGLLLLYRYWVSFTSLHPRLHVNAFHFLLYLCAVELLPLVLIYKRLINFTGSL
jgi:hypothetical protein